MRFVREPVDELDTCSNCSKIGGIVYMCNEAVLPPIPDPIRHREIKLGVRCKGNPTSNCLLSF